MGPKAILLDFNGVVINDEPLHAKLMEDVLLSENLRPKAEDYWTVGLGRSDRDGLCELFAARGRILDDKTCDRLIAQKSAAYLAMLTTLDDLPIYPGLPDFLAQVQAAQLPVAIVSEAVNAEIEAVLERAQLRSAVRVIVGATDCPTQKPDPAPYQLAIQRLNELDPTLNLTPADCLAVEDTYPGIAAAKQAGIPVAGVAHTHPFHMIQRRADWVVDYLNELDLDWLSQRYQWRSQVAG